MTSEPETAHQSTPSDDRPGEREANDSPKSEWRVILRNLGIQPSKALGQNFLHESAVVRRIVQAAEIDQDDLVIEVGPGLGVMTRELAARAGSVVAVELDGRLASYVTSLGLPNTTVVESDILGVDLERVTGRRPYVVVANLPYSVASAAIAHLLESSWRPDRLIVMVQREVAERIVARPPEMSILAVAIQFYGQPKILFRIGPGAFVPAPKVDSAVLRIEVEKQLRLPEQDVPSFFRVVRAGFSQRRKQLTNSLSAGLNADRPAVEHALTAASIDPRRRAETLDVEDWLRLFATLDQELAGA